jgi:putative dimethyl sulfoxide reductase chaperone
MRNESAASQSAADDLARECLYRFLSAVVAGPYSAAWERASGAENQNLALQASRWLGADAEECDIPLLVEQLHAPLDELRADYDRVFGLVVSKECPPYETEYYPTQETFGRSQQIADVAGFYRAFGIEPSQSSPERPDHLALELEFLAFLLLKKRLALAAVDLDPEASEQASVCERAHRDFFRDHLAWWVPAFAAGLRRRAKDGYPHVLARVLTAWIPAECRRLDISAVLMPVRPELIEGPEEQSGCAACSLHL